MKDFTTSDARELAVRAHSGQKYGGQPYVVHLDEVVDIITEFGLDNEDMTIAGYLHDVIEDTEVTAAQLQRQGVSDEVVLAIEFLSDAEGHNRKTRKANTYVRVRRDKQTTESWVIIGIAAKWADRIANLRSSTRDHSSLLRMYRKEASAFRDAYMPLGSFAEHEGFQRMLAEYDRLVA